MGLDEEELAPSKTQNRLLVGPYPSQQPHWNSPIFINTPWLPMVGPDACALSFLRFSLFPSGFVPAPFPIRPAPRSSSGSAGRCWRRGADGAGAMPARSRAGSSLRSDSPSRALRLPLEALRSADAPRTPDASSELGPGCSAPTAEVSGLRG